MFYNNNNYYPYDLRSADDRIWVQGEDAARAYLIAPNGFVRLWDSTRPMFYEKRADSMGKPQMEVYEYKRVEQAHEMQKTEDSPRINDIEQRLQALEDLLKEGRDEQQ